LLKRKDIFMNDSKQWYESKTVWGALVAILASLMQAAGVHFDVAGQDQLADSLVAISGALGGLIALYGRMSADKRLG
jgi:hypothetical protein